ncbi:hypothetical protein AB0H88_37890 [Nonomuraea sp. NPDC050680]|uniref:hypothetical protein n=1 Tax=Nonomuraea sp. NPDC050680 TaxID=3154630 RepID=UPI0033CACB60
MAGSQREPWASISALDLNTIGFFVVGIFLVTWLGSVAYWKLAKIEQLYGEAAAEKG